MYNMITIRESKNSNKVVKFISGESPDVIKVRLEKYCSGKYATRIFEAAQNGGLWGCYLTKSGRIRATFI